VARCANNCGGIHIEAPATPAALKQLGGMERVGRMDIHGSCVCYVFSLWSVVRGKWTSASGRCNRGNDGAADSGGDLFRAFSNKRYTERGQS
jgi:hypothetical protein